MYKLIKKGTLLAGILCISVLAAACGRKTDRIGEGMQKVEELDYESAITSFNEAIVNGEDLELAYRGLGIAYLGQTDYPAAIEAFAKALSHAGMFAGNTEYDINFYLATAQFKNGNSAEAIRILDSIIGLQKKNSDAYFLRGNAKMAGGDYEGAVEDLNQALSLTDQDHEMTIRVYQIFAAYGHEAEGKAYLQNAITKRADSMSDYEKGIIYFYMGDYDNARNFLETAKSAQKDQSKDIILMLGKTYEALGDSNYAASLYSKFLEEKGADPLIYNQLGLCKLTTGDYEAALNAFTAGLKEKDNTEIQQLKYNQIVAYEYLGQFEKAAELMKSYLKNYPDDQNAAREYRFLETR